MRVIVMLYFLLNLATMSGQGNCNLYPEGSTKRTACELCHTSNRYTQGSREKQMFFDSIITLAPDYAWTYYQKSVPYFKRGFLKEGLEILNKAIELEPLEYLCYRAYWHWQYKNYAMCIEDLERYYALDNAYTQYTPGGDKNMCIILGLAYVKNGDVTKGIHTIKQCLSSHKNDYDIGFSDYHTLGMLYVINHQYDKGIAALERLIQMDIHMPDTYYFLAKAYQGKSDNKTALTYLRKAKELYVSGYLHKNTNAGYKVYESDVDEMVEGIIKKSSIDDSGH